MQRLTDVVKNLLIINALMFLAQMLFRGQIDFLKLYYIGSEEFLPVQLVTHFFMHSESSLFHIFFNMFALVMFGPPLEIQWGPKRFLAFYLVCAFGAVALHMGFTWWDLSQMETAIQQFQISPSYEAFHEYFSGINLDNLTMNSGQLASEYVAQFDGALDDNNSQAVGQAVNFMEDYRQLKMNIPMLGASGAIYGLLLAFGMYYPNVELMLIFLPIPIKAKYFIPVLMLVELFLGFNQFSWDNIAHFAHLGGALTGFLLILYWRKFDNPYRRQ